MIGVGDDLLAVDMLYNLFNYSVFTTRDKRDKINQELEDIKDQLEGIKSGLKKGSIEKEVLYLLLKQRDRLESKRDDLESKRDDLKAGSSLLAA